MHSLAEYQKVFLACGLIGVILCFAPVFARVINPQPPDQFSELYLLGPGHMADNYPFSVSADNNYTIYIGVGNHLGSSMYYEIEVKLGNETDPQPNGTMESPTPVLYRYYFLITDNEAMEKALTFSFSGVAFVELKSCSVSEMKLNNETVQVNHSTPWDPSNEGFYYQLVVELWSYNQTSNGLLYDSRFVGLWLNMTSTAPQ